jgi:heme oxygenase (mycobilin-producing)
MVHMDLSGNTEEALAALHETLSATRERPGCLRVDVLQRQEDPGHVVLVETWNSPDDEAAYRKWRAEGPPNPRLRAVIAGVSAPENFSLLADI